MNCAILFIGDNVELNLMIKDRDFINIEDKYFGGSSEIFKEIETRDFSRIEPSGFLCLNDLLL